MIVVICPSNHALTLANALWYLKIITLLSFIIAESLLKMNFVVCIFHLQRQIKVSHYITVPGRKDSRKFDHQYHLTDVCLKIIFKKISCIFFIMFFSCVWINKCLLKTHLRDNFFLHISQLKGFSEVWINTWLPKVPFSLKF